MGLNVCPVLLAEWPVADDRNRLMPLPLERFAQDVDARILPERLMNLLQHPCAYAWCLLVIMKSSHRVLYFRQRKLLCLFQVLVGRILVFSIDP